MKLRSDQIRSDQIRSELASLTQAKRCQQARQHHQTPFAERVDRGNAPHWRETKSGPRAGSAGDAKDITAGSIKRNRIAHVAPGWCGESIARAIPVGALLQNHLVYAVANAMRGNRVPALEIQTRADQRTTCVSPSDG